MHVIPVTEGRKRLGELIDLVRYKNTIIALGKNGKADVLLVAMPGISRDFSMTEVNALSGSFAFLDTEDNLYSRNDLKKRYV